MSATETSEGLISHLQLVTECGVIRCPVKLMVDEKGVIDMRRVSNSPLPVPVRRDGCLVYALPGGLEVLS